MKVCFINLGCGKNVADGDVIGTQVRLTGFELTPFPQEADVVVLNTCGFLKEAEEEALNYIKWIRENAGQKAKIIVGGCFPQRLLLKGSGQRIPGVDLILGVDELLNLPDILIRYKRAGKFDRGVKISPSPQSIYENLPDRLPSTPGWAYVKISDGCSNRCTFCNIPAIKGMQRSRSIDSVVQEVKFLAEKGVEEINLVSQDTNAYGRDVKKRNQLLRLLERLESTKGIKWIRMLYFYPRPIPRSLLKFMRESEKVLPYFDIPVQHGDDGILSRMKRGMGRKSLIKLFHSIRQEIPRAVFRTSVIVGFPGEDVRAFSNLISFLEEVRFLYVSVFKFSREPGSPAYSMEDTVPEDEKERRMRRVVEAQMEITAQELKKFKGRFLEVLVENVSGKEAQGRAWFQAPESDGVVIVKGKGLTRLYPGQFVKTKIEEVKGIDLVGKTVGYRI